MNLRDLKYLVAGAEHAHYGRAALACNVSQPALSMQLQKLEDTLGVQLFERSNKAVRVTRVGEEIIARARHVLREAEEIVRVAKAHQDPLAGDFRLGAFPTIAPYFLPKIVPTIHRRLPKLNLLLVEEKTQVLLEMLHNGALDAALIALPVDEKEFVVKALFEDPFLLAVPKTHPLAAKKSVEMKDLRHERLLLLEEGHCLRAQALAVCELAGSRDQNEFRATSLETLHQMVVAGVGITLIPQIAARSDRHVAYIPFRSHAPSRTIGLVWRKRGAKAVCAERIGELVGQH
jgi:LysR family hydrogen peroxide-inducible transcriptional activator